MELTKALGAALVYLRSFWQTEALLHNETSEVRSLPEDLIVKILVKMPVKSLLRCRCVCKTWYHLIKSTNFVNMHLDYQKSNDNFLILCNRKGKVRCVISLHSLESPGFRFSNFDLLPIDLCGPSDLNLLPVGLCASCDGLVCLFDWKNKVLILCNPVMREFRLLDRYPFLGEEGVLGLPLAVGLGLASITNDYKVIVVVALFNYINYMNYEVKAMVYNLSTNSWREIPLHIPLKRDIKTHRDFGGTGTLFGGAVHWIDWVRGKIVSFDLNTEVFSDMELPRFDRDEETLGLNTEVFSDMALPHFDRGEGSMGQLIVFNGSLALFKCGDRSESRCISIWVMHKYGVKESWTKQLTTGPVIGDFSNVLLWKNEVIIVKSLNGKLGLVSLVPHETNSSYIEGIQGPVEGVMVYSESLISIK